MMSKMQIRSYKTEDEGAVIALWHAVGLTRPWNDPKRDIERKLNVQPELFIVVDDGGVLVATAMVGYDGTAAGSTTSPSPTAIAGAAWAVC